MPMNFSRGATCALTRTVRLSALAVCAGLLLSGCVDKKAPTTEPVAQAPADPMMVALQPDMVNRLKLVQVGRETLAETRSIPGRIEADAQKLERIGASVTGRVIGLFANIGDEVRPGQTLATLSSPELTQTQLAFLRAASVSTLAEKAAERARQLYTADALGSAELQRREAEASVARAEAHAAADQLRLLGVPKASIDRLRQRGSIDSNASVTSSIHGVVIERNVSKGQVVQPADSLFMVADLNSVWAVGGVAEQAARQITRGQEVTVEVPALGESSFQGRVVFVSDTVDPVTRTVLIRTEVLNKDRKLKPEMLATLRVSLPAKPVLSVPSGAVVREGDKDYVFIRGDNNHFRFTQVELGDAINERRPVLSGLNEGQTIVADGAFHLNTERKRAELE